MTKKQSPIKNILSKGKPVIKLLETLINYGEYMGLYESQRLCDFFGIYRVVRIELTNRCNLRCLMCPRTGIEGSNAGDIDFDFFKGIIDNIARFVDSRTIIRLYGVGEPLMYPRLSDAIEYTKTKCPHSLIQIATNGTLLDEECSKMLIRLLDRTDWLLLSINAGSKNTYRWLAGADRYDLVVNNIKNFLSIRKKLGRGLKPGVDIQILETKKTEPEIKEFKEFWKPLIGLNDNISVWSVINWGGKIDRDDFHVRHTGDRYPCLRLWTTICIDKDGNVYPCGAGLASGKNNELFLGNLHEKSFMDFHLQKAKLREMHLEGRWDYNPICSACDMWTHCPNIWIKNNGRFNFHIPDNLPPVFMYP
ncbi:MAG: radical SAM protein [Candidatus Altiarchaeota archaeon]|nr:radical SAM protein [Candidatus Altiarchaeota archaeon]